MLGLILVIFLIFFLIGGIAPWGPYRAGPYNHGYGFGGGGIGLGGIVLIIVIILLLNGRL